MLMFECYTHIPYAQQVLPSYALNDDNQLGLHKTYRRLLLPV